MLPLKHLERKELNKELGTIPHWKHNDMFGIWINFLNMFNHIWIWMKQWLDETDSGYWKKLNHDDKTGGDLNYYTTLT